MRQRIETGRGGAALEGVSPLGERALLVAWRDHGLPGRRWRLLADGAELPAPRATLTLGAGRGGLRLLAAALPPGGGWRRPPELRLETADGTGSVPIDAAGASQLALGRLARGLDAPGRARLASWMLGLCPALLPAGGGADLALLCRDLLDVLPPARQPAIRRCRLSDGWTLVEATPVASGGRLDTFVLGARRATRGLVAPAVPGASGLGSGPHPLRLVFEDDAPGEPAVLVLVGPGGVACRRLAPARGTLVPLRTWLGADGAGALARDAAIDLAALLAELRPGVAPGLAEEVRLLVPPTPASEAVAGGSVAGRLSFLAAGCGRLTVVGTLDDPHGLITALRLERLGTRLEISRSDWAVAASGLDGETFAAAVAAPAGHPHAPWRASLVLRSGTTLGLGEGPTIAPPSAKLGLLLAAAAPLADVPAAAALLGPPARDAAAEHATACRVGIVRGFGPAPARPRSRASLVLPLGGRDGAAARVVATLAAEPAGHAVEILLVAPEPGAAASAGQEAAALAARHGLPVRLVVPTAPARPIDLARLGAEAAVAPVLLTLGAGVVPRVRGWAGVLLAALDRWPDLALAGLPVAGSTAVGDEGHAAGQGPIPSLEAAALRLDALARAGGLAPDWLDPARRDLDLVARLLASGHRARVLAGPACVRLAPVGAGRNDEGSARLAAALDATRPISPRPADPRECRFRLAPVPAAERLRVAA